MATMPGTQKRLDTQQSFTAKSRQRTAITVTVLVCFFMFLNFADKSAIGLAGTAIMADLNITPEQYGIVQSSFFWLFPVGAVVLAGLTKWISGRWLLPILMFVWILTMIPLLTPTSFAILVVSRVLLGFAEGPAYALANHVIFAWFPPEKRNIPTSVLAAGGALGPLVSAPILTLVIATSDWHAQFAVLVAAGAVWLIAWLLLGKNPPEQSGKSLAVANGDVSQIPELDTAPSAPNKAFSAETKNPPLSNAPVIRLLVTPTIIGVILLTFTSYWVITLRMAWLPLYIEQALGFSTIEAGQLITIPLGLSAVLAIVVAYISNAMIARGASLRVARGGLSALCGVVGGVAFLLVPVAGASIVGMVLATLAFSVLPAAFGITFTIVGDLVAPQRRSAVLGWIVAIYSFAGVIAPLVLGKTVGSFEGDLATGYDVGFVITGAIMLIGVAAATFLINPAKDSARLQLKYPTV